MPHQQIKVLDHPDLQVSLHQLASNQFHVWKTLAREIFNVTVHCQDGFGKIWSHSLLLKIIEEELMSNGIDAVRLWLHYSVTIMWCVNYFLQVPFYEELHIVCFLQIITFDSYGVSGHCNHQDVHHAVRWVKFNFDVVLYYQSFSCSSGVLSLFSLYVIMPQSGSCSGTHHKEILRLGSSYSSCLCIFLLFSFIFPFLFSWFIWKVHG